MRAPVSTTSLFEQLARGWRAYALLAMIALSSALMGAGRVPPLDIDEARFAQATRQMVESGDYVRIRLQDAERNRKPIGIYWLQAASVHVFEPLTPRVNTIWPYRVPSALGLLLAALAAFWGGTALIGRRAALIGAALFATGLLAGIEGMTAKTDAVMVGFITLAIAALARLRFTQDSPRLLALVFWGALACDVLIKGVVPPMAAALTLLTFGLWERRAAWMKPLLWWPGPALAIAIAAPWLIAIGIVTEGRFYTDLLRNELGPKVAGADHAHSGAPGYYLLLLPFLIFPATYALPAAARLCWDAVRSRRDDDTHAPFRFLIAWAAPTFIAFELFPTKLVHYTLPVYPAIALMCGAGLVAMRGRRWRTTHPAGVVVFAVAGAAIVAIMATVATFMPGDTGADLRRAVSTGLIGVGALAAAITALFMLRRPTARALALIACALVLSFSLRERLLPEARLLFPSNEAVAALTRARLLPNDDQALWVVGYTQPSLVFLTRTSIRLIDSDRMGDLARVREGDAMVVEGRKLDEVNAALTARALMLAPAEPPVRGLALGRGERVTLYVGRIMAAVSAEEAGVPRQNP